MRAPDAADRRWMAAALALSRRGQGQVWPNPSVGCVIVKAGRVIGRGVTAPGGRPHAEAIALAQAGEAARGADAYVTLEPCAHQGRASPCSDALVAAGVRRVVAAMGDPDPRTAGAGFARLRDAGIEVVTGVGAAEATGILRGFLSRVTTGRPMVTLKLATSLDGRIATASGESRWITGPEARRRVHALRATHDAVMVGAGTARADDPQLTVRGFGPVRQPVRIVVSRTLHLNGADALRATAAEVPVWLLHGPDVPDRRSRGWVEAGARLIACPLGPDGQVDMGAGLAALGELGLTRIFCEGGGALAASLVAGDHVDDLLAFSAGLALGAEGQPGLGAMGLSALAEAPRYRLTGVERVGADVLHAWRRSTGT